MHTAAHGPDDALDESRRNGGVRIWEASSGEIREDLHTPREMIRTLAFSRTGAFLATGSDGGDVRVWSTETWDRVARMKINDSVRVCHWFADSSGLLLLGHTGLYAFMLMT